MRRVDRLHQVAAGPHGPDLERQLGDPAPQPDHVDVEGVARRQPVGPRPPPEGVTAGDGAEALEQPLGERALDRRQRDPPAPEPEQAVGVEERALGARSG